MTTAPQANAALRAPEAGRRVIRGGVIRAFGFGLGAIIATAAIAVVARHLQPAEFGRFASVMALIGIVTGLSDAGLTIVGAREVAAHADPDERRKLLANLLTLRCVLAPIAIGIGVIYALLVGWNSTDVTGTILVGIGLALINVQGSIMLPLTVDLRLGIVTSVEILRQIVWLCSVVTVVAAGGGIRGFFAAQVVVGLAAAACLPLLRNTGIQLRPAFDLPALRSLIVTIAPVAASVIVGVIYVRAVMLLTEQLTNPFQTGLFAASFRAFESLWMLPTLLLSVALPVLAVAGGEDRPRLAYALRLMTETALLVGITLALLIGFAAEPIIATLAGPAYAGAADVMRIQSVALVALFVGQAWQLGLLALRNQRALLIANASALLCVGPLALGIIPSFGAEGSASVAVIGETGLAFALYLLLVASDKTVAPSLTRLWRVVPPLAPALAVGLLLRGHAMVSTIAATGIFLVGSLAIGAVPSEIRAALRRSQPIDYSGA